MANQNGRLPKSALAPITKAVNGEQAYLRTDAARAFLAMNAESEARFGITLRAPTARVAYRTFDQQVWFWNNGSHPHDTNYVAEPGTSNHGWGLAIDLANQKMRWVIDQIGAKYGWAKKWSDAPLEWWHLKWRPGTYSAVESYWNNQKWAHYTASEIRWIHEYDKLKRENKDLHRREVLRRVMTQQRKAIWVAAQKTGWTKANRRARYHSLLARTS